jgi:hypothetical protein
MALIPPSPAGSLPGSGMWNDWIEKIRKLVNELSGGSINHNDLQNIQGGISGERFHLTNAQVASIAGIAGAEQTANKNIAGGYAGLNASSRTTKGVDTTDDVIIDLATKGLVLKDTQATPHYWRITISNVGALVISDLGTTKQ